MDPLMRQWLSGLKKQRTELDWQNRNFTLFEDVNKDVEEFKKRYQEHHGIDPTPEQLINAASAIRGGKTIEQLFTEVDKSVNPSIPEIKRIKPIDISKQDYERPSGSLFAAPGTMERDTFREKSDAEWNEAIETLNKGGIPLPEEKHGDTLRRIHRNHGKEALLRAMRQMAQNEKRDAQREMGIEPEPQEKVTPSRPSASTESSKDLTGASTSGTGSPTPQKSTTTTPTTPSGASTPGPVSVTSQTTPQTPEDAQRSFARALGAKTGKAARTGTTGLFTTYGAVSLPGDVEKIWKRLSEPTYARSEVMSSPDYKPEMSDAEIALRGKLKAAEDITRAGEHATMAGGAASLVPGTSKAAKAVRTAGELSAKVFSPLAAASSGAEAVSAAQRGDYGEATRRGAEGAQWAANMFPALSRFTNIGLGKQFTRGGMQSWLDPEAGGFEKTAGGVGAALGAGMLGKEALTVGKAFAQGGLKTGAKAALKSTGIGALVAAPFAISRAAEGDWAGAGLEVAGAVPGAAFITEPILAYRDIQKQKQKEEEIQKKQQEFMQGRYEKFMKTHPDLKETEQKGVPEFMKYGEEELRAQEAAERRQRETRPVIKEHVNVYEEIFRQKLQDRGI